MAKNVKTKWSTVLLILALTLTISTECKSMYGIGMRVIGDKLLVKDVLRAPPSTWPRNQTIQFNYSIREPITYIEIASESNVRADVNFSYQDDLVEGTATSIGTLLFEVTISIFGFDKTMLGVNPALILNKDVDFEGSLEPTSEEEYTDVGGEDDINDKRDDADDDEDDNDDDDDDDDDDNNDGDGNDNANGDNGDDYEYDDDDRQDNIIRVGQRQIGDYKIYEIFRDSPKTDEPSNHSLVFYYIDDKVITCAEFTVFDCSPANSPMAEYSHMSPHSMKANISDTQTTSLFVQLKLYGYEPQDLPVDFVSVLPTNLGSFPLLGLNAAMVNTPDSSDVDCPSGAVASMPKSLSIAGISWSTGVMIFGIFIVPALYSQ